MAIKKPSYAIIGGGIAGASLGIALHKRGIDITIYEAASHFGEIGAGVAFTRNAIEAMKICDQGVFEAFEKVATVNQWESKKQVWFDFLDGMKKDQTVGHQDAVFSIKAPLGMNGVHRAAFLDEMVKLVDGQHLAQFSKRLEDIEEVEGGQLKLKFKDGTTALADAVIGCDGIKSAVRHYLVGSDSASAHHVYTNKYAYRGLIDMDKAVEAIGEERAKNAVMWLGSGRHVLTFPVNHGETLNLVAFCTTHADWPDYSRSTLPAKREEAIRDFQGFGPNVMKLLELVKPELDIWGIFDLGENPLETYNKGKVCVMGDAAHATSPHHGSGAGFCIEDAAVMAAILEDPAVTGAPGTIEAAFEVYTAERKLRTQWLVQHSRRQGDLYEYNISDVGRNYQKMEQEITMANFYVEAMDVHELCRDAKKALHEKLSS